MMLIHLRPALILLAVMTALTGLAYPLAITGIMGAVAPQAAQGSLITRDGAVIGSDLIAQGFAAPGYLHPRPSASGWNAAGTGATNLGPTSAALIASVAQKRAELVAANGAEPPIDAVTTSGSGLDPHVSPQNARAQVARIAAARGVDPALVAQVIADRTEGAWLGLYGLPRVNVLAANLALDAAFGPVPPVAAN